jgi:hypothetical protein
MPKAQRDFLIEHVNGLQTIDVGEDTRTRTALFARDLIRYVGAGRSTERPHFTALTDLGREVVCSILGDYADALVKSGCLEEVPLIVIKAAPRIAASEPVPEIITPEIAMARAWSSELTDR